MKLLKTGMVCEVMSLETVFPAKTPRKKMKGKKFLKKWKCMRQYAETKFAN